MPPGIRRHKLFVLINIPCKHTTLCCMLSFRRSDHAIISAAAVDSSHVVIGSQRRKMITKELRRKLPLPVFLRFFRASQRPSEHTKLVCFSHSDQIPATPLEFTTSAGRHICITNDHTYILQFKARPICWLMILQAEDVKLCCSKLPCILSGYNHIQLKILPQIKATLHLTFLLPSYLIRQ